MDHLNFESAFFRLQVGDRTLSSIRPVVQQYVGGRMKDNEELRHVSCSYFTS